MVEYKKGMSAKDIVKLSPEEIEEKWATTDYHQYKPKSHEAVEAEWLQGETTTPEDDLIEQEEQEGREDKKSALLSVLTERQLEVVNGIYFDGKTQAEVAEELAISQQTVSEHLQSAIERMKKHSLEINGL